METDDPTPAHPFRAALRTGLVAGAFASVASSVVEMMRGKRETGRCVAPTNATSHWVWDRSALHVYAPTLRHTALGYAIHHAMSTFWAVLYAWAHGNRPRARSVPSQLAGSAVAAVVACTVDYTITPRRLTPGFEVHLSRPAMALVYAAFALGLAVGCLQAARGR